MRLNRFFNYTAMLGSFFAAAVLTAGTGWADEHDRDDEDRAGQRQDRDDDDRDDQQQPRAQQRQQDQQFQQRDQLGTQRYETRRPYDQAQPGQARIQQQRQAQQRGRFQDDQDDEQAGLGVHLAQGREGVLIQNVASGSPAQKAGLRRGDEILEIDGEEVDSVQDVVEMIRDKDPDSEVELVILRGDDERTIDVELRSRRDAFAQDTRGQQQDWQRQQQARQQPGIGQQDYRQQLGRQQDQRFGLQHDQRTWQQDQQRQGQDQQLQQQLQALQRQVAQLQQQVQRLQSETQRTARQPGTRDRFQDQQFQDQQRFQDQRRGFDDR